MQNSSVNPDLARERQNAKIDVEHMKRFLGELTFGSIETHTKFNNISND
jgi:hypothetical protein